MVVDDEADIIAILMRMLKGLGHEIIPAMNGKEALEKLKTKKPDLITLDIMMPDLDGYETLKRIKENKETSMIPVIMVSVKDAKDDIVKGLEMGAVDYITKPYNKTVLLAKVRSVLRLKRLEDKMRRHSDDLEAEVAERTAELQKAHEDIKEAHEKLKVQYTLQEKDLNLIRLQSEHERIRIYFNAGLVGISSITFLGAFVIFLSTGNLLYIFGLFVVVTLLASALMYMAQKKMSDATDVLKTEKQGD